MNRSDAASAVFISKSAIGFDINGPGAAIWGESKKPRPLRRCG
jgi:hypothetical protein